MTGKSDLSPDPKDKRFMDPAWTFNPFFKAGAQYYLAVQKGIKGWISRISSLMRSNAIVPISFQPDGDRCAVTD